MFTATLFTIARTWKQPRYPSTDEWIKKLWYLYTLEYYSAIKRNTSESVLMRWTKLEHITQSKVKSEREIQISYTDTYIWNLKWWHWWIYFQGSKEETENRPMGTVGGEEGEGEKYGESNIEIYNTIYKIGSQREFAVWLTELKQELCDRLKGGMGRGMGGRFRREGTLLCCCC